MGWVFGVHVFEATPGDAVVAVFGVVVVDDDDDDVVVVVVVVVDVDVTGWKGVNWMLYPLISRMSRYSLTSRTCEAGMWYAAPHTRELESCWVGG